MLARHHVEVAAPAPSLLDVDDTFEASTIAFLHAQVAGVQDIRCLVPFVLDIAIHYTRWCDLILLTLQRYSLDYHFTFDTATSVVPRWRRMYIVILSCLFDTIIVDLHEIVYERGGISQQVWLAIEEQFLGNCEARALHLDAQFRIFI
jgi:hypothetical protein